MNEEKKLKPVTFLRGDYGYTRNNTFQQQLLLKAWQTELQTLLLTVGQTSIIHQK